MAGNVQIKRFLLLVLAAGLLVSGCQKKPAFEDAYVFEERAENFTAEGPRTPEPFAADLAVITDGDDVSPALDAEAAAVFSLDGGEALFHKNAMARMNPASTTKIMTAILALKYGNLSDLITVGDEVIITEAGSSMCGVKPGDTMTLEQLLYGLMMPSGNDAANAIAVYLAGSIDSFADAMNEEAWNIGATGTHYTNANGLTEPEHYTTAYDLYLMFHEALKYPKFRHGRLYGSRRRSENRDLDSGELLHERQDGNACRAYGFRRKDGNYERCRLLPGYGEPHGRRPRICVCCHESSKPRQAV